MLLRAFCQLGTWASTFLLSAVFMGRITDYSMHSVCRTEDRVLLGAIDEMVPRRCWTEGPQPSRREA